MNPYSKAFDAMSPHDKHTSEGMTTEREAYAFDEGAAAERARIVAWLREKTADLVYAFPSVEPLWPQIVAAIEQGAHAREKP